MQIVLAMGLIVVLGYSGGALAVRLRLPRITGYLVVGMALSPSALHVLPRATLEDLSIVAVVALSIIGYAIGGAVRMSALQELGRSIVSVAVGQGLAGWALSAAAIMLLGPYLVDVPDATFLTVYFPVALVVGAIAWLTAPAVTIALVREYRAEGPLTTATLSTVALSDVFGVISFAVALALAQSLMGTGVFSLSEAIGLPIVMIAGAVGLGTGFGLALRGGARAAEQAASLVLPLVLGAILLCTSAALQVGVSPILATMVMGFVALNAGSLRIELAASLERVESLVFLVFFVLAGMYFDLEAMEAAGLLAVVIFLARCAGKYAGAYAGGVLSGAPPNVTKYVGLALLPKAGLTLGLALLVRESFPAPLGEIVFNGLLAATVINMLITPPLAKYALFASGEAATARRF